MKISNSTIRVIVVVLAIGFTTVVLSSAIASCKKAEAAKSDQKEILSFALAEQTDTAVFDKANKKITIQVKYNADLTSLIPTIKISDKATCLPASGVKVDLSKSPVIFTVTGEDKSTKQWMVYVVKTAPMDKKIITFTIDQKVSDAVIGDSTVKIVVSRDADLTSLKPTITVSSGATISPASGAVTDFSKGSVNYILTATDGSTKTWIVTVSKQLSTENKILSISVPGQLGDAVVADTVYTIYVQAISDLTKLQPVITVSPGATISPASGSAVDFSYGYANFTVTSESGAKKVYTINTPIKQFEGDNANIQYVGRINFANVKRPRFSAPGVYVKAKFSGTYLDMMVFDINGQNYVEVIIDNNAPVRMGLSGRNIFRVASGLSEGEHTVMIIKDTEASMGYLEFRGFRCDNLLPLPALPTRKIECFGNSITCGACMLNGAPCALVDNGTNWNGANCAYLSYGALTARALNAQWHISAVSGIGLIQSCCNMTYTMPDAYDRVYLNESTSAKWDFTQYVPDVVTICLGQNDGSSIVASKAFKDKYVAFINTLRGKYPNASVFCVTSPMADSSGSSTCLFKVMKTSLASIVDSVNKAGDSKVYWVTLPHDLRGGCTSNPHPNVAQHESIAAVLEAAIKSKMGW